MEPWGYSTHIDLYGCDPIFITSKTHIAEYVNGLCNLIDMKKFGECLIYYFGQEDKVKGYTFIQMIYTSLVSGHLVELTNEAHIDIFSCKQYDSHSAHKFTVEHFKATKSKLQTLER